MHTVHPHGGYCRHRLGSCISYRESVTKAIVIWCNKTFLNAVFASAKKVYVATETQVDNTICGTAATDIANPSTIDTAVSVIIRVSLERSVRTQRFLQNPAGEMCSFMLSKISDKLGKQENWHVIAGGSGRYRFFWTV